MSDEAGDKTEVASEKRRQEFREKGDIAKSRDLVSVLILSRAVCWENPSDEINRIFSIAYEINMQRLDASQIGPEQVAATKAFAATDRLFELIARFGSSDGVGL